MKRLLSIELQKIWQNKASKVLTITYFTIISLITLVSLIEFEIGPIKIDIGSTGVFNFPYIWHFNTYLVSILKIFLSIVVVSMVANEYSYGTFKQNLIDGMTKKEFIVSKFLVIVLFSLFATIIVAIITLFLGYTYSSYTETSIVFSQLEYLVAFFVKHVAFFSFCLFLGVLVKKSAFALGFLFFWNIVEGIAMIILGFVIFDHKKDQALIDKINDFFPLESMANLIKEPFTRVDIVKTVGKQVGEQFTKDYSVPTTGLLITITWTIIFILGAYYIIKKRDL
jgi:ABC-type transport system involved in multi-copper enzyme maturation permease subunit